MQGADSLPEEVWLHILSRVTEGNYGRTGASITSISWRHLCRRTYRSMHIDTRKGEAWQGFCTWLQLFGDQLTQLQLSEKEREYYPLAYYQCNTKQHPEPTYPVWSALMAHGSHLQLQQLLVQVALTPAEAAQLYQACIQAPALQHLCLLPKSGCLQGLSSLTQLQSLQLGTGKSSSSAPVPVITAADLTLLTRLTRLTTLQLHRCTFTSAVGSPDLGLLTTVQHLVLENVSIRSQEDYGSDWPVPPAAKLALAKHLSENFAKLTGLQSFRVKHGSDATTSAFLLAVPSLAALQQLELLPAPQDIGNLQPAPLAALSPLTSISRLSVAATSTLQPQAAVLFRQNPGFCSALVSLDVGDCQLTSLASLSDLHCLTYLSASRNPLTNFAALISFQQLRHLSLRKTLEARVERKIASEAWLAVAELGKLSWLEFTARKQLHSRDGFDRRARDREQSLNRVFHWYFTPNFREKQLTVAGGSMQSHPGGFGYGYGDGGGDLNGAVHDADFGQFRYEDCYRSRSRSDDGYEATDHVTGQEDKWDVPVGHRMPRWRNRSLSPAALAQWSSLHHLHFSLDMLPDVAAAKEFQRSLLSASPHLSELHLVSSDGYKQGLGMVGVAGFRWVQEVNLCACNLLDTGCFRYFAALPGVTRLVISDPMSGYGAQCGTDREREMEELQKGFERSAKTIGGQVFELEQQNGKWKASEDKWATGNSASGICTREAAELSGDSRWDDAEGDYQDSPCRCHRSFWVEKTPSGSHGSGGVGEDATAAPSPADGDIGGELGALASCGGEESRMSGGRPRRAAAGAQRKGAIAAKERVGKKAVGVSEKLTRLIGGRFPWAVGAGRGTGRLPAGKGKRTSPGQGAGIWITLQE